jgi:hypothetical protein
VTSTTTDAASAPDYDVAAVSGKLFLDAQNGFGTNGNLPARTPSGPYPGDADFPIKRGDGGNLSSSLSNQFKLIAQMLASGLPTEVFFTRLGGWDTHSNQASAACTPRCSTSGWRRTRPRPTRCSGPTIPGWGSCRRPVAADGTAASWHRSRLLGRSLPDSLHR